MGLDTTPAISKEKTSPKRLNDKKIINFKMRSVYLSQSRILTQNRENNQIFRQTGKW